MYPVLDDIPDSKAKPNPIISLIPLILVKGSVSKMIPIIPRLKLNRSFLETLSPISKNDMNDIKNGLSIINVILEISVNLIAIN